jgi:hypothetical protein
MWPTRSKSLSQPPRQLKTNLSGKSHQFSTQRLNNAIHSDVTSDTYPYTVLISYDAKHHSSRHIFISSI